MRHNFTRKQQGFAFLGMAVLVSAAAILLYSCKGKNDNKEQKNEQKNLVEKPPKKKEVSNKRAIYLTFDDGPNRGTQNLLKIIHERNVKATAFIVAKHVIGSKSQEKDYELLKNDSLFELANHSFSHANNKYAEFYKNPQNVIQDFDKANNILAFKNKIARTPGRNIWRLKNIEETDLKSSKIAANELENAGYKIVGWDLEWKPTSEMTLKGDHKEMLKKVDSIFFNDLEKTSRNLVFLTHDQYLKDENSQKELSLFIEKLQKTNRFQFKKISEYPNINEILN